MISISPVIKDIWAAYNVLFDTVKKSNQTKPATERRNFNFYSREQLVTATDSLEFLMGLEFFMALNPISLICKSNKVSP